MKFYKDVANNIFNLKWNTFKLVKKKIIQNSKEMINDRIIVTSSTQTNSFQILNRR